MIGQTPLFRAHLSQVHAQAAQFFGHGRQKVAGFFQLFEVLVEELVVPVIAVCTVRAAFE